MLKYLPLVNENKTFLLGLERYLEKGVAIKLISINENYLIDIDIN